MKSFLVLNLNLVINTTTSSRFVNKKFNMKDGTTTISDDHNRIFRLSVTTNPSSTFG